MPFAPLRVITVDETVETGNMVHTYDQVKTYIEANDTIAVGRCYCRHGALLRGRILTLCFDCAVCTTGCPSEAIRMVGKPAYPQPPKDNKALMTSMFEAMTKQA